jgi:hypothetical protein
MPEHDKAHPSLVIMVGAAKPSPWAKENPIDDRDEQDLIRNGRGDRGGADPDVDSSGDNTLITLFHALKRKNQSALNLCMNLASCLQKMGHAAHAENYNALRHWCREASSVCEEIDSMGDHNG